MKLLLITLISVISICSGLSAGSLIRDDPTSTGTCGDSITWSFYEADGLFKVGGSGNMTDFCNISMTDKRKVTVVEIENGVTSINNAFFDWYTVTTISIPSSVLSIGDGAFQSCKGLKLITIPDSVVSIGQNAFFECFQLTTVKLPNNLDCIPSHLFYSCRRLSSITIPSTVKYIGDYAFANTNITSISIPDGVESIGNYSFYGCTSLERVELPKKLEALPMFLFYGCTSLTTIDIPQSLKYIETRAFQNTKISSISIPDGVTSIGEYVFDGCTELKVVKLPNNLQYISSSLFSGCRSLSAITIPSSVKSIQNSAFSDCTSLKAIIIPSSVTSIEKSAFSDCSSLTTVFYLGTRVVSTSGVFEDCGELNAICVSPDYTSSRFCNITVTPNAKPCLDYRHSFNQCYEGVLVDGEVVQKKRQNATEWESQESGCVHYYCDNSSGPLGWGLCNSSDKDSRMCLNDKCFDKQPTKKKVCVEIEVEAKMKVSEMNIEDLMKKLMQRYGLKSDEVEIAWEARDTGFIVRVLVCVDNNDMAEQIADSVVDVWSKAKDAHVQLSGASSVELSLIIMLLMALLVINN